MGIKNDVMGANLKEAQHLGKKDRSDDGLCLYWK